MVPRLKEGIPDRGEGKFSVVHPRGNLPYDRCEPVSPPQVAVSLSTIGSIRRQRVSAQESRKGRSLRQRESQWPRGTYSTGCLSEGNEGHEQDLLSLRGHQILLPHKGHNLLAARQKPIIKRQDSGSERAFYYSLLARGKMGD